MNTFHIARAAARRASHIEVRIGYRVAHRGTGIGEGTCPRLRVRSAAQCGAAP